jgi:hypothetical protein
MIKQGNRIFAPFLAVALLTPNAALATPISWSTSAVTSFWQENGDSLTDYDFRIVTNLPRGTDSNTGIMTGSVSVDGATISYSGFAATERGVLHSSSSYSIVGPVEDWGVQSTANYTEYGVQAVDIGQPDLLAGITALKVTVDLDGTITGVGGLDAASIDGSSCQGSTCRYGDAEVLGDGAGFLGPISFYMEPANPLAPFDMTLSLDTLARSIDFAASGSSDFSDTATLMSIVAVDANNNPIPGVELQLGDGTYLGPNGYSATPDAPPTPSPVPEPSSLALLATGVLATLCSLQRRLPN